MDYTQLVIIHVLYAFSTVLTFWSAFIKSIKLLGPADEQARLYSTSEGSRYLIQVITGYISAGLGAIVLISTPFLIYKAPTAADPKNLASSSGIFFALLFYVICYVLAGLLSLFVLPGKFWEKRKIYLEDERIEYFNPVDQAYHIFKSEAELEAFKKHNTKVFWTKVWTDTKETLSSTSVWLIAFLIFFIMNVYQTIANFGTNILESLGLEAALSPTLSNTYIYGIPVLGAIFSGLINKKLTKSTAKSLIVQALFVILGTLAFLVITLASPAKPETGAFNQATLWIAFVVICFIMFFIGANRSIFWSTITELKVNKEIVGLAVGFISIIGFSKDVWLSPLLTGTTNQFIVKNSQGTSFYSQQALVAWAIFALINACLALLVTYMIVRKVKYGKVWVNPKFKKVFALGEQQYGH
ncbi:hypothetical protein BIX61_00665 [Mycoplasmoides pneumoniae]|uniref:hypothetical protein n=1 Tax=Mycoplasmoides pneumoniae TaxID=2104 RepID=UPI000A2A20F4|nr:hypothetical protein [Mycoplasmoides pneumoniae]ARQ41351.1 hypothetical protein BIX61_00665 [Mycoplasmoides pneumoniae]